MRISDWSSDVCSSDLVDHERLAAEDGHEANALLGQPQKSGEGLGDQPLAERAIRAIAGKAEHVVIERRGGIAPEVGASGFLIGEVRRSEEHTSELQSLMRISYAVFCLKKKNKHKQTTRDIKKNE